MSKIIQAKMAGFLLLLLNSNSIVADSNGVDFKSTELKPFGISLEWNQYELDLDVLEIRTSLPGVTQEQLDAAKGQLNARSSSKTVNVRLDYQVNPNFNIYGALGQVTDTTNVNFSAVVPGTSNLISDHDGNVYTVGAILSGKHGKWLPSLNFTHSQVDLDNNNERAKINTFAPSLGRITNYGLFSASFLYQSIEADYSATTSVPVLGDVPVNVKTENQDKWRMMAGWAAPIAKDLFINVNVGLNDDKQFHVQLNKRF